MVSINGTLLFQFINFFVLVAILAKFAYKPLLKVLEDRRNKIASDLDNAAKARETAEKMKADYEAQIRDARAEAQAIVDKLSSRPTKKPRPSWKPFALRSPGKNRSLRRKSPTNGKRLSGKCVMK